MHATTNKPGSGGERPLHLLLAEMRRQPGESRLIFLGRLASTARLHEESVISVDNLALFRRHIPEWSLQTKYEDDSRIFVASRLQEPALPNLPYDSYRKAGRIVAEKDFRIILLATGAFKGDDVHAILDIDRRIEAVRPVIEDRLA